MDTGSSSGRMNTAFAAPMAPMRTSSIAALSCTTARGKPIRAIGAMADISERKRAMEILEKRVADPHRRTGDKNRELEYEIGRRERVEECCGPETKN